jgi:hypothetical protein
MSLIRQALTKILVSELEDDKLIDDGGMFPFGIFDVAKGIMKLFK